MAVRIAAALEAPQVAVELGADVPKLVDNRDQLFFEGRIEDFVDQAYISLICRSPIEMSHSVPDRNVIIMMVFWGWNGECTAEQEGASSAGGFEEG
jgi:hypothetical protein